MNDFPEYEIMTVSNRWWNKSKYHCYEVDSYNAGIEAMIKFMITNKLEEGLYDRARKELKK